MQPVKALRAPEKVLRAPEKVLSAPAKARCALEKVLCAPEKVLLQKETVPTGMKTKITRHNNRAASEELEYRVLFVNKAGEGEPSNTVMAVL